MSKCYKLRELINRLEELSKNGRNDGMTVEVLDMDGDDRQTHFELIN